VGSQSPHACRATRKTDLDDAAAHASETGTAHAGIEPGGVARILQLADPYGNRVVLTGA
jgi:hypothetical protein